MKQLSLVTLMEHVQPWNPREKKWRLNYVKVSVSKVLHIDHGQNK